MNTSFKEFANKRNIEIGIRCLIEAEQNAVDDEDLSVDDEVMNPAHPTPVGKNIQTTNIPPVPKNIQVPNVPPTEKSWVRKWWDRNKTMLKYGALGAAAIGLLLGSGIPWGSLFPFMARTVGTGLGVNAILGGVNSVMNTEQPVSDVTKIIIRGHDCFIKTKSGEIKVSPSEIPDMILRNPTTDGHSAVIWRTETSRAKTEDELLDALREKGLEDSVLWKNSFDFVPEPRTANVPEFE